ncbi:MAG TPA: DUF2470 domain-containing protein [Oscillatoriaceae cyanobacterium M33_DOE_052]|uniref:DUF2470 domain-containing protein n=1 Tax=Planktothricoides sp. SpSt-374 TaxID=2282167 RepID=A0A7C3VKE7_9CYAN|nr:DUF2470 domain-containing protein [Oscillatoriaceae cyanobacterium M33_DOE_052]
MADPITAAVSDRICKHMNEDHADAVLIYARVFGKVPEATAAEMVAIDPEGMDINASITENALSLRIPFDHTLQDAEDAHQTLISMIKQARSTSK